MRTFFIATAILLASALPARAQMASGDCLACHDNPELTKDAGGGRTVSVHVDPKKLAASVHGPLDCTNCHADIKGYPHDPAPKAVDCASCHPDSVAAWDTSLHAKAVKSGSARGARCADCHGQAHEILASSDPKSKTAHGAIPATCSACHGQKFVMAKAGLSAQSAISYEASVHGRAVAHGSAKAAVCTDCHDHHAVRPANDPLSGIFKFNVARTCGQCHAAIAAHYAESVHGKALARGNWNAPVCTDCHGIHTISRAADQVSGPNSSCARCHEGVRLSQEFGIPGARVSSYESSYHGLARRMGSTLAANCASCHTAHDVLPTSDPRSAVNPRNLQKTCGRCHTGAQANFTHGKIHRPAGDVSDMPSEIVAWIRRIYITLIILTIGFMLLHNALIWWKKAVVARRSRGRTVERMNLNQRIQHAVMGVSFVVLVISGFALAWPDSIFAALFGPSEQLRRMVHRVAAVIMMAIGLYHLAYMTFTREGRKGLRDLWFRFADAGELIGVLRFNLGFSNKKPQFARFSYAEKGEYWAGMWGTIVMALTGLMIWNSVTVAAWIPRWWIDVATTVHYYEAILATLAILVWHFYHVIFDPDVYPMNWAWFDGKMSEEQFKEEHPKADDVAESETGVEGKE
jgi:cytochrome b subunit of formate dehydrogenase